MNACQSFHEIPPQEMQPPRAKESRVVVIREEFIVLTGDPLIAALLNQMVYWSQRVTNFDQYMREEKGSPPKCRSTLQYGWFYKSSVELIEETMLCVTPVTLRRYLTYLEESGWIEARENPQYKWDRTTQYRVNLRKLSYDLQAKGYALPGFLKREFLPNHQNEYCEEKEVKNPEFSREDKNEASKLQNDSFEDKETFHSNGKKRSFEVQENDHSKVKKMTSRSEKNVGAIPENTTEIINKEHTHRKCARANFADFENSILGESVSDQSVSDNSVMEECVLNDSVVKSSIPGETTLDESIVDESVAGEMVAIWKQHVGQKILQLTSIRQSQLESLFAFHFKNDIRLWEGFCLRIKATPFLMGGGPNGWKVKLDWILQDGNLLKILEGNYDGREEFESQEKSLQSSATKQAEKAAIVESIQDPIWRSWCAQLAEGLRYNESRMLYEPLSAVELERIANARFLECEDDRLVWVGSSDQKVLNKIEDLRMKISWVYAKQYPKAHSFRTRLEPLMLPLQDTVFPNQDTDRCGPEYAVTPNTGEIHV